MTSVTGGNKVPRIQKKPASHRSNLAKGGIHSRKVILIESDADEFVPNLESATGMHGFAIMVPPEQRNGWLLDMLWRITMAYAAMPSLLYTRTNVRKMVEAVISRQNPRSDSPKPRPSLTRGRPILRPPI